MLRIPLPDPPLGDDRIRLRPWRHSDAAVLAAGWRDDEVSRWNPVPADRSVAYAQRWISGWGERRRTGLAIDLVITDQASTDPLGEVGVHGFDDDHGSAEIGFWLLPSARKRGYAGDAVRLVADWICGAVAVRLLYAKTAPDNAAAEATLGRAGFVLRGTGSDGNHVWKFDPAGAEAARVGS